MATQKNNFFKPLFLYIYMKIFTFADTHGDLKKIDRIVQQIKQEPPQVIICAGDISNFGKNLKESIERFKELNIPLLMIPGNHETAEEIKAMASKYKFMINLHKASYELNNYIFFGYGEGGFSTENKSFEEIILKFKKTLKKDSKIILITHAPPHGTKLDLLNSHIGCKSIRKFIEEIKPILHISGHLHENKSRIDTIGRTVLINPGDGKVIEI